MVSKSNFEEDPLEIVDVYGKLSVHTISDYAIQGLLDWPEVKVDNSNDLFQNYKMSWSSFDLQWPSKAI